MSRDLFADPRPAPRRRSFARVAARPAPTHTVHGLCVTPMGREHADVFPGSELYRMHTQPHLYDAWQREAMDDNWLTLCDALGKYTFDCDVCCKAVMVDYLTNQPCPNCGTPDGLFE